MGDGDRDASDEEERDWLADLRSALLPADPDADPAVEGEGRVGLPWFVTAVEPEADRGPDPLSSILARLDAIEGLVRSAGPDLSPLEHRLAGIEATLAALGAPSPSPSPAPVSDVSAIEARLDAVDARLARLADAALQFGHPLHDDEAAEQLAALARRPDPAERIDALARAMATLPASIGVELARIVSDLAGAAPAAAPAAGPSVVYEVADATEEVVAAPTRLDTELLSAQLAAIEGGLASLRDAWVASDVTSRAEAAAAVEAILAVVDVASSSASPAELAAVRHQLDAIADRVAVIERAIVALASLIQGEIDRPHPAPSATT